VSGSTTASTSEVASSFAELTFTRQPPSNVTARPSGIGFSQLLGGTNVTAVVCQPLSRKEHVGVEPLHAPVHFASFQPFAAVRTPNGPGS
jgi:hypothetical protein